MAFLSSLYKKILFIFSCFIAHQNSKIKINVPYYWDRNDSLTETITIKNEIKKGNLILEVVYDDKYPFQNIFLHIQIKNDNAEIIWEKSDLLLELFDVQTGYPLGRKLFKKKYSLEFLIDEKVNLKTGKYNIETQQKMRQEKIQGIQKINLQIVDC